MSNGACYLHNMQTWSASVAVRYAPGLSHTREAQQVASAYQINAAMEAAQSEAQLAAVLSQYADDMAAIESRGYRTDYDQLRNAAIIHAERVTATPFAKLLSSALSGY
jgi:hypothetical protein